jgi:hypothetical protein
MPDARHTLCHYWRRHDALAGSLNAGQYRLRRAGWSEDPGPQVEAEIEALLAQRRCVRHVARTLLRQHSDWVQPVLLHQVRLGDHQHCVLLHGQHRVARAAVRSMVELHVRMVLDGGQGQGRCGRDLAGRPARGDGELGRLRFLDTTARPTNTALNCQAVTASSAMVVNAQGYQAL